MSNGVDFDELGAGSGPSPQSSQRSNERASTTSSTRTSNADAVGAERIRSRFARPFGRTDSNEVLGKALKSLTEIFAGKHPVAESRWQPSDFKMVAVDSIESQGSPAAIIVYLKEKDTSGVNYVFYHTLILEASGVMPPARESDFNGRKFNEVVVIGDVWSHQGYRRRVETAIKSHVGQEIQGETHYINADAHVIYSETNVENDHDALRTHLFYTIAALSTLASQTLGGDEPLSLNWLDKENDSVEVSVSYDNRPKLTPDGLPQRTDVRIATELNLKGPDGTREILPLTEVSGAMELVYAPAINTGANDNWEVRRKNRQRGNEDYPIARPVFWLNNVDSSTSFVTLQTMIIGLASVAFLYQPEEWARFFDPATCTKPQRDVGLFGLLSPACDKKRVTDTKSPNFSYGDYLDLMSMLCNERLTIGIEVEQAGHLSWQNGLLVAIADGNETARRELIKAIDELTDNHFSDCFDPRCKIVAHDQNIVLNGYTRVKNGEMDALGEVDTQFLLDLREKDPEQALLFQDTFDQIRDPMDYRLANRVRQYENHLGNSWRAKSKSVRLIFETEFFEALAEAFKRNQTRLVRIDPNVQRDNAGHHGNNRYESYGGLDVARDLFRTGSRRGEGYRDYRR